MLDKPLEQIEIPDLEELIADKVQEGKTIDYKQAMYRLDDPDDKVRDKQREELLKDVSSFANTIGGHLIIGMAEDDQVPTAILGVPIADRDKEKNRLHQLIAQWLEPRINYDIHAIEVEPGKYVLVIRVPQSLVSPHRVVHKNQFGQFWARNSTGAFAMDTTELRRAFTLSETIYEQIKGFRKERVRSVMDGEAPVPLRGDAHLILHLIPLDSFATRLSFSIDNLSQRSGQLRPLTMYSQHLPQPRINFDGIVTHWGGGAEGANPNAAYVQLFRSGVIEAVVGDTVDRKSRVPCYRTQEIEAELLRRLPYYLGCLKALGVQPPIWCFLTLLRMQGVYIADERTSRGDVPPPRPPIDREVLYLPEALIDDCGVEPTKILRPLFDMIWNAAGWDRSEHFDANGNWKGEL